MSSSQINLDFKKLKSILKSDEDILPVAVQDVHSKEVLMVAFANLKAVKESFSRQQAVFWSTSRQELWIKGESSGDTLRLIEVRTNCYENSLLYIVELEGKGMCHTKDKNQDSRYGCFYRKLTAIDQSKFIREKPYSGS